MPLSKKKKKVIDGLFSLYPILGGKRRGTQEAISLMPTAGQDWPSYIAVEGLDEVGELCKDRKKWEEGS